mmetsp:Transcript_15010/g.20583  ORF Transcript_15010/g.20583 Transcript_15010/m.20583 type:complete len:207 (-) Transcript_15010:1266-1886(-)
MKRRINYYEVLGLKESTEITTDQVKTAYFALAKKYHPDVANSNSTKYNGHSRAENTRKFREISDAYNVLKNNSTRANYYLEMQSFTYASNNTYSSRQQSQYKYGNNRGSYDYGFHGGKTNGAQYLDALFHPRTIFIVLPFSIFILTSLKTSNKSTQIPDDYSNRAILNGPDKDTAWFNPWKKQWQTNAPWLFPHQRPTTSKTSREQ